MVAKPTQHMALLWDSLDEQRVGCRLCAHGCVIAPQQRGRCGVRINQEGQLFTLTYNKVCSAQVDPIEKKPLFHFLPGSTCLSIATEGCNFQCRFCQNWQISQAPLQGKTLRGQAISPEQIVAVAQQQGCQSIAYTYTEPTIYWELAAACGVLARQQGIRNVFVSNGYMTRETVVLMADWLDGINIDLKAFSEDFYQTQCHARLQPVLETIRTIARETDIWLELTTLIVPGLNDDPEELKALADFIVNKAGPQVPWHISRFTPQYQCLDRPGTPLDTLEQAYRIGKQAGLQYVYLGNVPGSSTESTYCSNCQNRLIERAGFRVVGRHLKDDVCPTCGTPLAGIFTSKETG